MLIWPRLVCLRFSCQLSRFIFDQHPVFATIAGLIFLFVALVLFIHHLLLFSLFLCLCLCVDVDLTEEAFHATSRVTITRTDGRPSSAHSQHKIMTRSQFVDALLYLSSNKAEVSSTPVSKVAYIDIFKIVFLNSLVRILILR